MLAMKCWSCSGKYPLVFEFHATNRLLEQAESGRGHGAQWIIAVFVTFGDKISS